MSTSCVVGEVSVDGGTTLRWTLPRYMQTPHGVDTWLRSPYFTFRGVEECLLCVYPNGRKCKKSEGWTGIQCLLPYVPPASTVTCCVVGSEGREILHTETTERRGSWYSLPKWMPRSELEARSEELLPGGTLRVVVWVVLPDEGGHSAEEEEEEENGSEVSVTKSKEISESESHTQNNKGAESGATGFSESSVSDCTRRHIGLHKHIQDLKDLYVRSKDSDLMILVQGREFRVHRLILKARIPAFDAMLSHDTVENKEGVVKMEDCNADVFHEFLLFIYSGTLENLSPDNMCGLYVLGDKYGLQELKELCLDFMKTSLSVQMICDVVTLAITHREAELLKLATDFFVENAEEIMVTVKWQVFNKENPDQVNELFLKTVKFLKAK